MLHALHRETTIIIQEVALLWSIPQAAIAQKKA